MSNLFLIIGNSGAGKDTLIKEVAARALNEIKIARRVVTRATSDVEDYESVDTDEFFTLKESGEFILDWESYDTYYGIRKEVEHWLKAKYPVMINVSRQVVDIVREKYPDTKVIFVRVPLEVTAERIIERKRESYEKVLDRVVRAQDQQDYKNADLIIDNVGNIEETSQIILDYIYNALKENNSE
jgi:ribose 1,5-bisphosphokinase